jgi:hypothetical protein
MKSGLARLGRRSAVAALALALAGCESDSTTRPPVVIVTPEPVRAILAQTSFENFQSDIWVSLELILSQKGVMDVTVDWTFPTTWMYVYVGKTNCSYAQLSGRTCPFFLSSETKDPKPRVLFTESLEPGTYYLVLYNVPTNRQTGIGSDNTEAVSLQLGLTVQPGDLRVPGGVTVVRSQTLGSGH